MACTSQVSLNTSRSRPTVPVWAELQKPWIYSIFFFMILKISFYKDNKKCGNSQGVPPFSSNLQDGYLVMMGNDVKFAGRKVKRKIITKMKKLLLILAVAASMLTAQAAKVNVDRIEPTDWYVGLNSIPSVQLMVYGNGIGSAEVSTQYPGVTIDSVVRVDSPNYLLIYMDTRNAQPGTMELKFQQGKSKKTVKYQLKAREMRGSERRGFTNADVLYMLMPDRFADGNPANNQIAGMEAYKNDRTQPSLRHGGDIEGIRQHLDYFTELGVTALWFTPVLENNSPDGHNHSTYHGYATTNYYQVDPRFGTNEEYRRLCDEAHSRGLKVVMDMIFNHCGAHHPWLKDMPTHDWFNQPDYKNNYLQTSYKLTPVMDPYASEIDLKETVEGWFVPSMPDLNHHNVHVMNYLIQNSVWWIETVGIDGIRMDTYPYAYADAMARWMKVLNDEYPYFNVVGETWVENPERQQDGQARELSAHRDGFLLL